MSSEDFFNLLENRLQEGNAMVSYRLPGKESVELLSQTSNSSFRIEGFSESGFIFSPFKNTENPLFIPEKESIKTVLAFFNSTNADLDSTEKTATDLNAKAKSDHINLVRIGVETIKKTEL
jgi:isochorismate synthase